MLVTEVECHLPVIGYTRFDILFKIGTLLKGKPKSDRCGEAGAKNARRAESRVKVEMNKLKCSNVHSSGIITKIKPKFTSDLHI